MVREAAGLFGLVLGMWQVAPAMALEPGDVAEGAEVARAWCSNCHATGTNPSGSPSDAAPPFAFIARQPDATPMSLRVFLQTPHSNMPNYQLSRKEMDDVIAYLLSMRSSR